jgi:hypothetical protein
MKKMGSTMKKMDCRIRVCLTYHHFALTQYSSAELGAKQTWTRIGLECLFWVGSSRGHVFGKSPPFPSPPCLQNAAVHSAVPCGTAHECREATILKLVQQRADRKRAQDRGSARMAGPHPSQ